MKWMYERQGLKAKTLRSSAFLRWRCFGETTCQILADILQKDVVVVESPQNIGAAGAAACIVIEWDFRPPMKDTLKNLFL